LERRGAIGDDSCVALELDTAALPDDAASLRALLAERDAVIAERDAALAERDARLLNASLEIEKLKVQLAACGATATASPPSGWRPRSVSSRC
jgi:hypothetical protein